MAYQLRIIRFYGDQCSRGDEMGPIKCFRIHAHSRQWHKNDRFIVINAMWCPKASPDHCHHPAIVPLTVARFYDGTPQNKKRNEKKSKKLITTDRDATDNNNKKNHKIEAFRTRFQKGHLNVGKHKWKIEWDLWLEKGKAFPWTSINWFLFGSWLSSGRSR